MSVGDIARIATMLTDDPDIMTSYQSHYEVIEESAISEGLEYHISNNIPLHDSVYRPYSRKFYELIREAKALKEAKKIRFPSDSWLNESDVGKFGRYEGEVVPLDLPIMVEWLDILSEKKSKKKGKKKKKGGKYADKPLNKPMKNSGKGKKYVVYVKNPKTGNIKKITFGDKKGGLEANWNDAEARKNFASRHNCASKTDKLTAGYWACRAHKYFGKNVPGRFW